MIMTLTKYRITKHRLLLNLIFLLLSLCIVNSSFADEKEVEDFPWEIFYPAFIKKSKVLKINNILVFSGPNESLTSRIEFDTNGANVIEAIENYNITTKSGSSVRSGLIYISGESNPVLFSYDESGRINAMNIPDSLVSKFDYAGNDVHVNYMTADGQFGLATMSQDQITSNVPNKIVQTGSMAISKLPNKTGIVTAGVTREREFQVSRIVALEIRLHDQTHNVDSLNGLTGVDVSCEPFQCDIVSPLYPSFKSNQSEDPYYLVYIRLWTTLSGFDDELFDLNVHACEAEQSAENMGITLYTAELGAVATGVGLCVPELAIPVFAIASLAGADLQLSKAETPCTEIVQQGYVQAIEDALSARTAQLKVTAIMDDRSYYLQHKTLYSKNFKPFEFDNTVLKLFEVDYVYEKRKLVCFERGGRQVCMAVPEKASKQSYIMPEFTTKPATPNLQKVTEEYEQPPLYFRPAGYEYSCPPGGGSDKFACCASDGTCSEITLEECEESNGTPQDGVAFCTEDLCPQPVGACCGALGVCYETGQDLCESAGDTYKGTGTTCTPGLCPEPKEYVVYTIDNWTCFEARIVTVGERSRFQKEELVCNYYYYADNTCTQIASKTEMQGGFDNREDGYEWLDGLKGEWMINRWCPGNGYYKLNGKSGWYMIF